MNISGTTRLGGLLGSPVAHSISPRMHNDSFQALGLDYVYLCFDVGQEKLPCVVSALRDMNVYGFNLTMPDKEAVIPCLDELSQAAHLIGAVNTVVNENGRLIGHNTDGIGFMRSVAEEGIDLQGKEMTLLGAGGAAQAIAVQAAIDGVKKLHLVCRHSRSWDKAVSLADRINAGTACRADLTDMADTETVRKQIGSSALLVNATSAGMEPHTDCTPLTDASLFEGCPAVGDVIYHPRQTRFLKEAAAHGCRTFNGMYMLLYQGAAAFRIWTGTDMPVDLIRDRYFR